MHASSLESMWACYRNYIADGPLEQQQTAVVVLDIGSANVNGSYREIFQTSTFRYIGLDMEAGPGVDIVMQDPYKLPMDDKSVDIVISGQAFEHCEFFWLLFLEMVRVLKEDGFIFLIAPSAGPIHRYPVDCYRFYPDAYNALAKFADCVLVESWLDERGPWRDLVGVFRRASAPPFTTNINSHPIQVALAWNGAIGTAEEEAVKGEVSYLELLDRLHRELMPQNYLEIGVRHGGSLALARGLATGVDPAPAIARDLPATTKILSITSDDFFARYPDELNFDFSFIDGMHLVEYALRDFMNIERRAAPGGIVVVDDIFPNHEAQALRERRTRAWTGDIWRLLELLQHSRPDLFILPLDVAPTGLMLVAGLDPTNRTLWDGYNSLVRQAREPAPPPQRILERLGAVDPTGAEFRRVLDALRAARAERCAPHETVARLRRARDNGPGVTVTSAKKPQMSVIVVGCNMARELPRTIRSLSPLMQQNIDPDDYEVIVLDNGSNQAFDENETRKYLPGLIVHRLDNASVSPVPAINIGLSMARGDLVGVCIDGARICSPGLLAGAMAAARLHRRPVIGTFAFHLGSQVQMESVKRGYNQQVEDQLLADSGWEEDGYRLFEISVFAGSSSGGWFELPAESNAFFLRADHWRSFGGWDEGFVTPGGGLANLDMWHRACSDTEGELIVLLGEGTFHQVHGGIATNNPNPPLDLFHAEYVRLRGRPYERPTRNPLYFGRLPETAKNSLALSLLQK